MLNKIKSFFKDESGMETIEVIVIIIVSLVAVGLLVTFINGSVNDKLKEADKAIDGIDFSGVSGKGGSTGTSAGTGTGAATKGDS